MFSCRLEIMAHEPTFLVAVHVFERVVGCGKHTSFSLTCLRLQAVKMLSKHYVQRVQNLGLRR